HRLKAMSLSCAEIRLPQDLTGLDGRIIPGGESTTIGKLAVTVGLMEPIRRMAQSRPVWGTCAGAVFMANQVQTSQPVLGLMDITIQRNAFGRQVSSFEADLDVPFLPLDQNGQSSPFHAIFIRAPLIENVGKGVEVLVRLPDSRIVAARQGHFLVTSFHPELTKDDRFHRYFLSLT
ncbi:MAG TPA: pyridoxal 5'-phosphate synthase glutaminase subunit PdxT, partial [Desulfatirhabdiaceae bacterium]|nr:pyridoxal 5'-phosphate synthase glutaminase subunit PdxT [Desulfatirhabdiaceae bacterium]